MVLFQADVLTINVSFVALWVRLRLWGAQNSQGKKPQHISSIVHKLYHFNCLSLDEDNTNIQSGMSSLWCKLSGKVKLQFNLFEGPPYLVESRTRSQMKWQRGVGRGRKTTGVQETNWRWGGNIHYREAELVFHLHRIIEKAGWRKYSALHVVKKCSYNQ